MPKPELLIAKSSDTPNKKFFVMHTKNPLDEGETLKDNNISIDYCGNTSLADTWMGWGIVRMLAAKGKQAVLLFNDKQKFILPEGQDDPSK